MKDFLKFTWDVGFLVLSLCHSPGQKYKAKGLYWRNPVRYFGVTRLDCWHKHSPCFSHSLLCKCDKLCLSLLISCNSSVIFPILQNKWVKGDDSSLPSVLVTATWSSGSSSGLPSVQQRVMKMIKVLEYLTLGEDETAGTIHPRQERTWGRSVRCAKILDEAVVKKTEPNSSR